MNFDYYIPTRILFGAGRLNDLHKQKLPGKKALIVISNGKSTRANGYLARVEKELELAGAAHVVFDKVQPNPTKDNVMEGAALARAEACDFVLGLGGRVADRRRQGDCRNGGQSGRLLGLYCGRLGQRAAVGKFAAAGRGGNHYRRHRYRSRSLDGDYQRRQQ